MSELPEPLSQSRSCGSVRLPCRCNSFRMCGVSKAAWGVSFAAFAALTFFSSPEPPKAQPIEGPVARISNPRANSVVRGTVAVFGVASAPFFKSYRIEFGEGLKPTRWTLVKYSTEKRAEDPYAARTAKFDPQRGHKGNLADWLTGLLAHWYGRERIFWRISWLARTG